VSGSIFRIFYSPHDREQQQQQLAASYLSSFARSAGAAAYLAASLKEVKYAILTIGGTTPFFGWAKHLRPTLSITSFLTHNNKLVRNLKTNSSDYYAGLNLIVIDDFQ